MDEKRLKAIRDRCEAQRKTIKKFPEPLTTDEMVAMSEFYNAADRDVPDLLAEVERLRVALEKVIQHWEDRRLDVGAIAQEVLRENA